MLEATIFVTNSFYLKTFKRKLPDKRMLMPDLQVMVFSFAEMETRPQLTIMSFVRKMSSLLPATSICQLKSVNLRPALKIVMTSYSFSARTSSKER